MFCNYLFYDRHLLFCILQFLGSTAGSISLCMSVYGVSLSLKDDSSYIPNSITCSCILITIITSAIKDGLIANPKLLKREEISTSIDV